MRIHALAVLSNHLHLLVSPDSPQQLAAFMGYVAGNLAREIGGRHGWQERFWGRRYTAVLVSSEEKAQIERLVYILGQGVKEGLVERPQHWPGVHCAKALLSGKPLQGTWIDRTALYKARRRLSNSTAADFAEDEQVTFTPVSCWAQLDSREYRTKIAELVARIVDDGRRARAGRPVLGRRAILAQDPHDKPLFSDRSPAPLVHAASKEVRVMLRTAYYAFVAGFREAAARLRAGDRLVVFPMGAFPPPLPAIVASG